VSCLKAADETGDKIAGLLCRFKIFGTTDLEFL
jgi:hypothetical protein